MLETISSSLISNVVRGTCTIWLSAPLDCDSAGVLLSDDESTESRAAELGLGETNDGSACAVDVGLWLLWNGEGKRHDAEVCSEAAERESASSA